MIQAKTDIKPAQWQITATTVKCDVIDEAVTLMVNRDWTTRCIWYQRYKQKSIEDKKQKFERKFKLKIAECTGPDCPLAIGYRDKLIQEEFGSKQEK
jgi:hypothetical protein